MQSDPIGLAGGLNTYGYVMGNPVMWMDSMGLDGEAAIAWAMNLIDSTSYQYWDPHVEVKGKSGKYLGGRFTPKCNAFVYDALSAGGDAPGRDGNGVIPVAGTWDNPKSVIPGYSVIPPNSPLKPGDVVADTVDGNTHVGLYLPLPDGKPGTVSASTKFEEVIHNDWGFRPENTPTVWRCDCDK